MDMKEATDSLDAVWRDSPDKAIEMMESVAPWKNWAINDRIELLNFHRKYVVHKEWHERIKAGLMPYHSHDIEDRLFKFGSPKRYHLAAQAAGSALDSACATFAMGDGRLAEQIASYVPLNHIASAVRFSNHAINAMSDINPAHDMPEVTTLCNADAGNVIWLSCSGSYMRFLLPFLRSIRDVSPKATIHVHVMDPVGDDPFRDVLFDLADGLSEESPGMGPGYYHAARFIRLNQWMDTHYGNAWLMDVDAILNSPVEQLFKKLDGVQVAMRARPARLEPWNQLNACVVGFRNDNHSDDDPNKGNGYLKLTAQYIRSFLHGAPWGLDQLAMLGAYEYLKPEVATLDDRMVDYDYQETGVVWCNSGRAKFSDTDNTYAPRARYRAHSAKYERDTDNGEQRSGATDGTAAEISGVAEQVDAPTVG